MKELSRSQLHWHLSRLTKATAITACRATVTTNGDLLFSGDKVQELTFSLSGTHKSLYGTEIEIQEMERGKWQSGVQQPMGARNPIQAAPVPLEYD